MILSLIRFPFAVVGQAVDIAMQMRAQNKLLASMWNAPDSATVPAGAVSALMNPPVSSERPDGIDPRDPVGSPNLTQPDPSEIRDWPDWLVMRHAANCLMWPKHAALVDELRTRSARLHTQR